MDQKTLTSYFSILSYGYTSDIVDAKEILGIIMDEFINIIPYKILPCISLVNKIIYKQRPYSINFIKVFIGIMLQHGFLEFRDIIEILNGYTLFDTNNGCPDEQTKYIIMEILRITENNISDSTKRVETKGNIIITDYNKTTISANEFDTLMIFLIPFLHLHDSIVLWRFLDVFESYVYNSDKQLSLKWLSNPVLFKIIKPFFADTKITMSKVGFKDIYKYFSNNSMDENYNDMIRLMSLNVIVIYYNPTFYSPTTLNKLYIENRACEILRKKTESRILYYTNIFAGLYRPINPEIAHNCLELPSCLVRYILSFVGIDELIVDLMDGRFHL